MATVSNPKQLSTTNDRKIDNGFVVQHTRNMRYAIVTGKTATGYSAFVPDLPGCIRTARDKKKVETEMRSAIWFNIDSLKEGSLPVPQATSIVKYVEA